MGVDHGELEAQAIAQLGESRFDGLMQTAEPLPGLAVFTYREERCAVQTR